MTETIKLSDLTQDPNNANKGTDRGRELLEDSLHQFGAGRSILLDKEGRIIAGNKTAEAAQALGIDDVVIVRTSGDKVVAVLREDLDLTEGDKARLLAYYDNRVGELDLSWDAEAILADVNSGLDLGALFDDLEMEALDATGGDWGEAFGMLPEGDRAPFQQMTFTLHDTQAEAVKEALSKATGQGLDDSLNENSNGNALYMICEAFTNGG